MLHKKIRVNSGDRDQEEEMKFKTFYNPIKQTLHIHSHSLLLTLDLPIEIILLGGFSASWSVVIVEIISSLATVVPVTRARAASLVVIGSVVPAVAASAAAGAASETTSETTTTARATIVVTGGAARLVENTV
jgi:uncharacterized membrane protein